MKHGHAAWNPPESTTQPFQIPANTDTIPPEVRRAGIIRRGEQASTLTAWGHLDWSHFRDFCISSINTDLRWLVLPFRLAPNLLRSTGLHEVIVFAGKRQLISRTHLLPPIWSQKGPADATDLQCGYHCLALRSHGSPAVMTLTTPFPSFSFASTSPYSALDVDPTSSLLIDTSTASSKLWDYLLTCPLSLLVVNSIITFLNA